jgi:hypothetical protein
MQHEGPPRVLLKVYYIIIQIVIFKDLILAKMSRQQGKNINIILP